MIKILLSTLVAFFLLIKINAQETDYIKSWQQQHPNVVFVSNDSYHDMSPSERERLDNNEVIFFSGEISLDDINSYDASVEKNEVFINNASEYLKQWISDNADVKVVKNSQYESSTPAQQEEYLECTYCMVLIGEEISLDDISNYESEKN